MGEKPLNHCKIYENRTENYNTIELKVQSRPRHYIACTPRRFWSKAINIRHYIDLFDRAINRTQITQIDLIFADFGTYAAILGNQKHKNQRKSGESGKSAFH